MDTLKRFLYKIGETARELLPERFFTLRVLPAGVSMLLALDISPLQNAPMLDGGSPAFSVSALAFAAAVWCAFPGESVFTALLGMAAGSAAVGKYCGIVTAALMLALSWLLIRSMREKGLRTLHKYGALLASLLLMPPVCTLVGLWHFSPGGLITHLGAAALTLFLALVMAQALGALPSSRVGRAERLASDARLLALSLLAGLTAAAFGFDKVLGVGLGAALTAFFCMSAAHCCALSGIALAAVAASVRVFALHGDLLFIAVLCLCTLSGVLFRPLGKFGVLTGFMLTAAAFSYFIRGTGTLKPPEMLLGGAAFMLLPIKLRAAGAAGVRSARERRLERELLYRNAKLAMLSDVLFEMASLFGGEEAGSGAFINRQLSGVAKSLSRLTEADPAAIARYRIGIGSAGSAGAGDGETGDSALIRELEGMSLAAISDGMGTGKSARRESEQTVQLLADLVSCGFRVDEAADCVNRLLLMREGGEMYATLDAMLFDRERGSVTSAKHGAPASYILRRGKLSALYAEALPVGIVEEAKTAVFNVKIKRGDVIIMMSDGVSDALGDALDSALKRTAEQSDPRMAARELVESARRMGGADDMTAIVAMVG